MDHVHFNADEVCQALHDIARSNFETALAEAHDDHQRAYDHAQFDSIQADMVILRQVVAMKNAGRSAVFIGRVVGVMIGRNIVNIVHNMDDPAACMAEIDQSVRRMIGKLDETNTRYLLVHGERGGRA